MPEFDYLLPLDAFIRAVKVDKNIAHGFFIGAGASITSGIKSASDCIWDWKRELYLTKNPELHHLFNDISSQHVRQTIQNWLDTQGSFPPLNDIKEYSFYIEKAFPIIETRRQYFQNLVQHKKPYIGYNLLALLSEAEIVKSVFTTNFDGLVSKAASNYQVTPIEIGIDSKERVERVAQKGELPIISLHGDYRYDKLKNTNEELKSQESLLINHLKEFSKTNHLVVCGYSGRDESIMSALTEAYSQSGMGRLYWCGYNDEPSESVLNLISTAKENNREAYYVRIDGFEDVMMRLTKHCLSEILLEKANEYIASNTSNNGFTPFNLKIDFTNNIIKSNLFPIKLPSEIFQFKSSIINGEGVWKKLKETIGSEKIAAVPFKGNIYAISSLNEINKVFEGSIESDIIRTPLSNDEIKNESSSIVSLLNSALVRILSEQYDLYSNGKSKIWIKEAYTSNSIGGIKYNVHKAAFIGLKGFGKNNYISINPSIHITSEIDEVIPDVADREIKRVILDKQFNKLYNEEVGFWRGIIFPLNKTLKIEYPKDAGEKMFFELIPIPVFTKIMKAGYTYGQELKGNTSIYKQEGIEYKEPTLLFCSKDGSKRMQDTHPIRGILNNQPYDFSLSQKTLSPEVTLGIICPKEFDSSFNSFIRNQHKQIEVQTNKEYLFNFPGFNNVFGIDLSIPEIGSNRWQDCTFDINQTSSKEGSLNLAKLITEKIESIHTTEQPNIIIVYIPSSWSEYCGYSELNERFDLHDYLKAFAAQRGIATQIIREETTLNNSLSCQIHWWLALSFYAKSLRTPWVLNNFDKETAFAGIGYSIDHTKEKGNVLLGCSHIYNSQGEGLKYKLSKVDNPTIIQEKPHLSKDDALRFANSIRQLFWEAMGEMPKRVVIHKRTFFTKEEKQGILEGLGDIEQVDLIEINFEKDIRYVASKLKEGKASIDGFPVSRGTCVQLDASSILLWTHGAVPHAHNQHYKYFKGGRRIPAPLKIKKHHGISDVHTIANEILGLTKMHWNTFDMYTQLPATIHSSNEIARIGSLLDRFDKNFDYRLFI